VKGLSFTPRQARQFIIHGHISVKGRTVKVPGYLVSRDEEPTVAYDERSPIADELHPLRVAAPGAAEEPGEEKGAPEGGGEG